MKKDYLLSVIIPNYNHSRFLTERIDSVLAQTFQDFEMILMDDCSTDNSREIIEKYREHSKVSQIHYNEVNSGSTFSQWNKGISLANGKYIWIAESDDVSAPTFLEKLLTPMLSDEKIVLSFSQSYRMNHNSVVTGNWLSFMRSTDRNLFVKNFIIEGRDFIKRSLIFKNTIPNASSLVFTKEEFLQVGKADTELKYCSDWLTWLKISLRGKVAFTSEPLNYFRYHNTSVIANAKSSNEVFVKKYDIMMRNLYYNFLKKECNDTGILRANEKQKKVEIKVENFIDLKEQRKYLSLLFYFISNIFNIAFVKMLYEVFESSFAKFFQKNKI